MLTTCPNPVSNRLVTRNESREITNAPNLLSL